MIKFAKQIPFPPGPFSRQPTGKNPPIQQIQVQDSGSFSGRSWGEPCTCPQPACCLKWLSRLRRCSDLWFFVVFFNKSSFWCRVEVGPRPSNHHCEAGGGVVCTGEGSSQQNMKAPGSPGMELGKEAAHACSRALKKDIVSPHNAPRSASAQSGATFKIFFQRRCAFGWRFWAVGNATFSSRDMGREFIFSSAPPPPVFS